MKFWASSESYAEADFNLDRARRCIEPYIIDVLRKSSMSNIDITIRYVPIVMPKDMHDRYKERSRAKIKQGIYECAPHLDYEIFTSDNFHAQISEYIRGISLCAQHLIKFGLKPEQVNEFTDILTGALKYLSEARPNQARH